MFLLNCLFIFDDSSFIKTRLETVLKNNIKIKDDKIYKFMNNQNDAYCRSG